MSSPSSSRSKPRSSSKSSYGRRINRVVNHLAAHPTERFSIAQLAQIANFSDFHFHRLFKAYTGETPAELARRLRLERAAADLLYQPISSITDLALSLGFSSSANFTKAFSAHFGVTPSSYAASRSRSSDHSTKQLKDSNPGKAAATQSEDTSDQVWVNPGLDVVINEQPRVSLAYVRHVGPYRPEIISGLFAQLTAWAQEQELAVEQTLGITWSDSSVAEPQTWRYDAAMEVADNVQASNAVDIQRLAAGKIAVLELTLAPPDYSPIATAWDYLLGEWLPRSGWLPAHRPSFERYHQVASGEQGSLTQKSKMTLCLPVEPIP